MKNVFAVMLSVWVSLSFTELKAQAKADQIVGFYLTYDDETGAEKSQVQIYKSAGGKYSGKIVWLKEPNRDGKPKLDEKNSNTQLRLRPVMGMQILENFVFDENSSEWNSGTIYNPVNGKTYKCYMKFESATRLKIRGYIGAAWMGLGKTAYWTKELIQRK